MAESDPDPDAAVQTTLQVRRAMAGDRSSTDWIVQRLSPLLLAQAEYRLGPALRTEIDPADLVAEAWLVALPKLAELTAREGRTVMLSAKVDPDLLGGLVVTIGSQRIDASIRTRLNSLAKAMQA